MMDFSLLGCYIPLEKEALINQFRRQLPNDVKDFLVIIFHKDPKSVQRGLVELCDLIITNIKDVTS